MTFLNGKWKLMKIERFEEYMEAIGVDKDNIKKGLKLLTPENNIIQDISVDGNQVCIKTVTPLSNQEHEGEIGKTFEQPGWDGRKIQAKFTLEGDKLIESLSGPYTATQTRYIKDGYLIMELNSGSVTSVRTYSKC